MTTYMLVDTSPEALPRGIYDSAKDVAAALGVAVDSIYHPENKRGNDRIYRMGREKVRLIRIREKEHRANKKEPKVTVKLAKRPPDGKCTFPGLAAMMVEV